MEERTSPPPDPLPSLLHTPPPHSSPPPLPQSMDATEMPSGPSLEVVESGSGTVVGGAPRQSAESEPLPCAVPADCISLGPYIAEYGGLGGGSAAVVCSSCLSAASVQEPSPTPELDGLQRVFAILGSEGIDWDSIQVEQKWEEEGLQRVYEKFGLRQDDEKEDKAREEGCDMSGERSLPTGLSNEPVCGDKLPNAEVAFCD